MTIQRRRTVTSEILMDGTQDWFLQMNDLKNSLIDFRLLKYEQVMKFDKGYNKFTFEHCLDIDDSQY